MTASHAGEVPTPETTWFVLLGAGSYPRRADWTNPVLGASARALRDYVTSPMGLAVPAYQILDLFDDSAPAILQCERIGAFLRDGAARSARDLILYYIGHGTGDYYLGVHHTERDREYLTGLDSEKLALVVHESFRRRRVNVIVDACYAGSGVKDWQGSAAELVVKRMSKHLPRRGTSYLAAASKYDVALAPRSGTYTLFTGALLESLQHGIPAGPEQLTLYQIYERIRDRLSRRNQPGLPLPEIHAPRQQDGDVSQVPLFPNAWYQRGSIGEIHQGYKAAEQAGDATKLAMRAAELGYALLNQGEPQLARERLELALVRTRKLGAPRHVANLLDTLARARAELGDLAGARAALDDALELKQPATRVRDDAAIAASLSLRGVILAAQDDLAGAKRDLERALEITRRVLEPDHASIAAIALALAHVHRQDRELHKADEFLNHTLAIQRANLGEHHLEVADTLVTQAGVLADSGDLERALAALENALVIQQHASDPSGRRAGVQARIELARILTAKGQLTGARVSLQQALTTLQDIHGDDGHPDIELVHDKLSALQDLQSSLQRLE